MDLKLDLNERERERYAGLLYELAKIANRTADAIQTGDDGTAAVEIIILSLSGRVVMELQKILLLNVEKQKPEPNEVKVFKTPLI